VELVSRRQNLRLVMEPSYDIFNGPRKVGVSPSKTVAFYDGRYQLPPSGEITYEDGRKGDASEALEWLRTHRLYGDREEGFWEMPRVAPAVSQEETRVLLGALAKLDEETLLKALEEERTGWAREDFIVTIEGTLAEVQAIRAEAEKRAMEQVSEPKPGVRGRPKAAE
jgi:hypothetical protein